MAEELALLAHYRYAIRAPDRDALRDAGLFHSVYGTESYQSQTIPIELRPRVVRLIGEEAERLAWLFGVMKKESFYALLGTGEGCITHRQLGAPVALSRQDMRDLCDLTVANWLEQRPRAPEQYQRIREVEFRQMLPLLLPGSRAAIVPRTRPARRPAASTVRDFSRPFLRLAPPGHQRALHPAR